MRSTERFLEGVGAGLLLAGVAFWITGAVKQRRARRAEGQILHVDGAGEADLIALSVRLPEEVSSSEPLMSEVPDYVPSSQRW